jgi:hypothetical protein
VARKTDQPVRRRAVIIDEDQNYVRSRTINSRDIELDNRSQELNLERAREKRRLNRKRRSRAAAVCILVLAGTIIALASQYTHTIGQVSYDNSQSIIQLPDNDRYINLAQEYLGSRPTERLSFSFHSDGLTSYLSGKANEIETATIYSRPFIGSELRIKLREPLAVWQTAGGQEFVDASGAVFDQNYFTEPSVLLKDESGVDINEPTVASRRFLNFIGQVIAGVDNGGAGKVSSVAIPLGSVRYVELRVEGQPYPIKAQIDRDPASQTSDIVNMIKYLTSKGLTPSYVDVRIEGKGYWK